MQTMTRRGDAYKQTIAEIEHPRDIERRVFSQVTRDLEKIIMDGANPISDWEQNALARNQKLWGALLFDVMEKENPLPDALKAGIISLAMFVDSHTTEVIAGRKSADALVSVNRSLMRGLAGTPAGVKTSANAEAAAAGAGA